MADIDRVVRTVTNMERRMMRAARPGGEGMTRSAPEPDCVHVRAVSTNPSLSGDPAQTEEEHHSPDVEHAADLQTQ